MAQPRDADGIAFCRYLWDNLRWPFRSGVNPVVYMEFPLGGLDAMLDGKTFKGEL
jgi:hypothetical protein